MKATEPRAKVYGGQILETRTVAALAQNLGKDRSTLPCRRDGRGQTTGKALPGLAAAGGIYGSRIDLGRGAG